MNRFGSFFKVCVSIFIVGSAILGCDDDFEVESNADESECTAGEQCEPDDALEPTCTPTCLDVATRIFCVDGVAHEESCENGCELGICKTSKPLEPTCEPTCLGATTRIFCVDGVAHEESCENGCELGICKTSEPLEPTCVLSCLDASTLQYCEDNQVKTRNCGDNERCREGACEPDPCVQCLDHQICVDDVCRSRVGVPCSCLDDDCTITYTSSDLNGVLTKMVKSFIGAVGESGQVTMPNLFSEKIVGCESLAAGLPEGMRVGCFRESELRVTQAVTSWLDKVSSMSSAMNKTSLANFITEISTILKQDPAVSLVSPHGYCFVGAMDLNVTMVDNSELVRLAMDKEKVSQLMNRLDAGTYETAKTATCPEGSVLIADINKQGNIDVYGTMTLDMAMCLQSCETNADCRSEEGYQCLGWHDQKVCFIRDTIDEIHQLEVSFGLVKQSDVKEIIVYP